jgi:hypothetical protein
MSRRRQLSRFLQHRGHNGSGNYNESREATMRYYDRLPAVLRQAIASARMDWATGPLYREWRRQGDPAAIAARLRVFEERHDGS